MMLDSEKDYTEEKSDFRALFWLFSFSRSVRKELIRSIALIFLASVAVMVSAYKLGELVNLLMEGKTSWAMLWPAIAIIMTMEIANIACTYFGRVGLGYVTNQSSLAIRKDLFKKVTELPISYFDREPLGRIITRVTSDVEGIENFFTNTLARVFMALLSIVSVSVAMIATDPKFGAIVALTSLPSLLFTFYSRLPIRDALRRYKSLTSQVNSRLAEYINGMKVIKAYGLEGWSHRTFNILNHDLMQSGFKVLNINSVIRPFSVFLCALPMITILWWGGLQVLAGSLTVGIIVTFVRYAERYSGPIIALTYEAHVIQEALSSLERLRHMFNEADEFATLGPSGSYRAKVVGDLSFDRVTMGYLPDQTVLKGVSFAATKGQKIGLVGHSGSGKTTTISLMPALYPIRSGTITIDGVPLTDWDRTALRQQIGVVSQNVVIFSGTIRENLTIALDDQDIDPATIDEACRLTGLAPLLASKEQGLDTYLVDGGDNLSQGERQLIAFTRMLLKDPAILILDEATANIDPVCEQYIQQAIYHTLKNRTCFIIAHRLHTITKCDSILVFKDGSICEKGNHEELLAQQGVYAQLASKQLAAERPAES